MTSRESLLIKSLIIIGISGCYWEFIYNKSQYDIEKKQQSVAALEENLSMIYQLNANDKEKTKKIMTKYSIDYDGGKQVMVNGYNKTASILKTLNKNKYDIKRVVWEDGKAKIIFQ